MKNKILCVLLAFCILSLAACSGTSEKSEPTLNRGKRSQSRGTGKGAAWFVLSGVFNVPTPHAVLKAFGA